MHLHDRAGTLASLKNKAVFIFKIILYALLCDP